MRFWRRKEEPVEAKQPELHTVWVELGAIHFEWDDNKSYFRTRGEHTESGRRVERHDLVHIHVHGHGQLPGIFARQWDHVWRIVVGDFAEITNHLERLHRQAADNWCRARRNL